MYKGISFLDTDLKHLLCILTMTDTDGIKDRIKIIDLAKQLGIEFTRPKTARCFNRSAHNNGDKNPSLSFDTDKNRFYCFACGVKGDIFDLYREVKGVDFKQALAELGALTGVSIPAVKPATASHKPRKQPEASQTPIEPQKGDLTTIYEDFKRYCGGAIDKEGYEYLTGKTRGLTAQTIDLFGIFAVRDYGATKDYLLSQHSLKDLQTAGLFNETGNLIFLKHRLITPFTDSGEIVFLQGRRLDAGQPKYLNLKQRAVPLFNKDTLKDTTQGGKVYICEGVFDAMILEQNGFKAVAIVGVNGFKPEMTELFKGLDVVLALDNDASGKQGTQTLAKMFSERGQTVKVKNLPEGIKDITEFFTKGEI